MKEPKMTRAQLEKRRDELTAQLNRVNRDERIELDPDEQEQAIQIEQSEVATTMEANLRRELIDVEDKLLDLKDE